VYQPKRAAVTPPVRGRPLLTAVSSSAWRLVPAMNSAEDGMSCRGLKKPFPACILLLACAGCCAVQL
jgi:hypothetical protein